MCFQMYFKVPNKLKTNLLEIYIYYVQLYFVKMYAEKNKIEKKIEKVMFLVAHCFICLFVCLQNNTKSY